MCSWTNRHETGEQTRARVKQRSTATFIQGTLEVRLTLLTMLSGKAPLPREAARTGVSFASTLPQSNAAIATVGPTAT
jgi:hypothetical protein